jgi:hypothetical protein
VPREPARPLIEAPAKPGGAFPNFHLRGHFFGIFGTPTQSMVGIELRRAGCRWGGTKPALSIASWDLISTMATFSEAPL